MQSARPSARAAACCSGMRTRASARDGSARPDRGQAELDEPVRPGGRVRSQYASFGNVFSFATAGLPGGGPPRRRAQGLDGLLGILSDLFGMASTATPVSVSTQDNRAHPLSVICSLLDVVAAASLSRSTLAARRMTWCGDHRALVRVKSGESFYRGCLLALGEGLSWPGRRPRRPRGRQG